MQTRIQAANQIPTINIIPATQEPNITNTPTSLEAITRTPSSKRTISDRHSSTTSEGSIEGNEAKRGKLSLSDTFIDLSTPQALLEMSNDSIEPTDTDSVQIKLSVLNTILSKLEYLEQQVKNIAVSQENIKINLLTQDIKSDKMLITVNHIEEDLRSEKILQKVLETHTKTVEHSEPCHRPTNSRVNIPASQSNTGVETPTPSDHIPIWKGKFHKRRMAYKQSFYNKAKAQILKKHVEAETMYILRKHRPKFCHNNEDFVDRLEVSKALQIQESKSLLNSAKQHEATILAIDRAIEDAIMKTTLNPAQKEDMRKQWRQEVTASKLISEKMVADNIMYMKDLPNKVPFTGFSEYRKMPNGIFQLPNKSSDHQGGNVSNSGNQQQNHTHNYHHRGNYRGYQGRRNYFNLDNENTNRPGREPVQSGYRVFRNSAQANNTTPFRLGTK